MEMKKLILENLTDLPTETFLKLAEKVISMGRISNNFKQYCYASSFKINNENYFIVSVLNKKSDKLILYKEK